MDQVSEAIEVSVVIAALDAETTIGAQLESLSRQVDAPPFEVLVADNGSRDGTESIVDCYGDDSWPVTLVDASDRRSAAHARNVGAAAARGSRLLFCDADDIADPRWVVEMDRALTSHDGVGGRLVVDEINPPETASLRGSPTVAGLPAAFGIWPVPIGASCGIRAARFHELGGFDESFPGAGGEDTDLFIRLQEASGTVAWAPDAVMHYRYRTGLRAMWRQAVAYGRANTALYVRHRDRGIPPMRIGAILHDLVWMAKCIVLAAVSTRRRGELVWWCGHTVGQLRAGRDASVFWIG
jgi:glycosyltransferase involved in cell wall biosynthesis